MITQEQVLEFIRAIKNKRKVLLRFYSKEDGSVIERLCAPMDYGPNRRSKDTSDKMHFWDYNSDKGSHPLSLPLGQIVEIIYLDEEFDPRTFVKWDINKSPWFIERDWGDVS